MTDLRWQEVTCSGCGRTYQCTPTDDFYTAVPGRELAEGEGICEGCLLRHHGLVAVPPKEPPA